MNSAIKRERGYIGKIPAIIWGEGSKDAYVYVHGKMSCKENAEEFAKIAQAKGYQTISFDLPEHGERNDTKYSCDIWNGKADLLAIAEYAFARWEKVSLYACSLGAHFSLHAYKEHPFKQCLFQSPILDMEYLIQKIFGWYQVSEHTLRERGVIDTPIHRLTWAYFQYVKEHPITRWDIPTEILYAGKDELQSMSCMERFASQFHCGLTVLEESEHGFSSGLDIQREKEWLERNIK